MKRQFGPFRLRTPRFGKGGIIAIIVGLCALTGWSFTGNQIIASLNPMLRRELSLATHPALDVWISPPEFSGAQPTIISTPASLLYQNDIISVLQGSTISAHLAADRNGETPQLIIDGVPQDFTTDSHGDFAASEKLTSGNVLSIRRGPATLARWKIHVIDDAPPKVSLTEPLTMTAGKVLRVAYCAADDFGVARVALRITPRDPLPGAANTPVDIALPAPDSKLVTRVDFAEVKDHPWAGQSVSVQVVATNESGKTNLSEAVEFTFPDRHFFHPIARVLIEERRKLLLHPDDQALREEAADIMAGIAHETADYHADPVVLMALRASAVRLILDRGHSSALSVNDMLWHAAIRIEDGSGGQAEQILHDARQDLAEAVIRNADEQEIEALTERLKIAMQTYLSLITAHAHSPHAEAIPQSNITQNR